MDKPRDPAVPMDLIVHYGPTGTCKTRKALHDMPGAYKWSATQGSWFDGYDGHKEVVIDEFRNQIPFGAFLNLTDRYPMKVGIKGGFKEWKPEKIIITSPVHPALWYAEKLAGNDGNMDQLKRRIAKIYYFKVKTTKLEEVVVEDHTDHDWSAIVAANGSSSNLPQYDRTDSA